MDPVYSLPPVFRGPTADALPMAGEVNWGMEKMGVDLLRTVTDGRGVKVGGVDTGVDATHPILGNVAGVKDFTGSPVGAKDRHGHGTHIMGTIGGTDPRIGVAPGCTLYHGKGLGDSGSGGNGLIHAVNWCAEQGCEVISNSWGGGGRWPEWEREAIRLAEAGVWCIYAGGNAGPNTPDTDWPGRSEHVINVAALNPDLSPASFSSAGDKIDTSGPGVDIWSAKPGGGFQRMSGTSMATPFVAGLLTLYRAALKAKGLPIPTIYELRKLLFSRSTDAHSPGDDRRTGPGWVTPLLLTLSLTPDPPPLGG